jgi:hypothetical protein
MKFINDSLKEFLDVPYSLDYDTIPLPILPKRLVGLRNRQLAVFTSGSLLNSRMFTAIQVRRTETFRHP